MAGDTALLPQPTGGLAPGAALALLVHVGLVVALTIGVNWRMKQADTVSAELWAALPQVAAPRLEEPPTPTPAPPPPRPEPPPPKAATPPAVNEAQIAIERERKAREEREKERERAEAEKKKREAEADKKREADEKKKREQAEKAEKADQERREKLREEQLKRMQGTLSGSGAPTSTGTAAVDAAPSAGYAGRLIAHIRPNIVFADTLPGNPAADVEVRAAPGGTVISRRLVKSSGFKDWDEAVLRAIDRSGTLPRDTDGRVPSTIIITFRRNE